MRFRKEGEDLLVRVRGEWMVVGQRVDNRSLLAGHAYTGGDSARACMRRLRQMWARVEKAARRDPLVKDGREQILDHAADDPNPEYTAMHLGAACLLASEDTGAPLSSCMAQLCDELDNRAHQEVDHGEETP